jgi:probable HAF family extracellular repeat protein
LHLFQHHLKLLLVALAVPLGAVASPHFTYTAKALIPLSPGQGSGVGEKINNAGVACGMRFTPDHPFCYFHGVVADIAPLPGDVTGQATAINNAGAVVGSTRPNNPDVLHAFLYADGHMTDLGTLDRPVTEALGINDAGSVVGWSRVGDYYNVAFLYKDGVMRSLGTMHGAQRSIALAINNNEQIVGSGNIASDFEPDGNDQHAFLYENGVMADLGTLGGRNSTANSINEKGQVAGTSDIAPFDSGQQRAFIYTAKKGMRSLGTLPNGASTRANGINKHGEVVGSSLSGDGRAFLYQPGVGMRDLTDMIDPASGWVIVYATSINDHGQIVGYGCKQAMCAPVQADPVSDDDRAHDLRDDED